MKNLGNDSYAIIEMLEKQATVELLNAYAVIKYIIQLKWYTYL